MTWGYMFSKNIQIDLNMLNQYYPLFVPLKYYRETISKLYIKKKKDNNIITTKNSVLK